MLQTAFAAAGLVAVGIGVTVLGGYRLGLMRAARKWDAAAPPRRVGRGLSTAGVLLGLVLLAAGVALLTTLLKLPGAPPVIRPVVAILAALATLLLGMYVAARFADRVELNALLRTPSRIRQVPVSGSGAARSDGTGTEGGSDPVVPPTARPGWVYRDPGGAWYLVVSAGAGYRLVSLPDFKLVPVGMAGPQITAAGSVELAVWPLSDSPGVREAEAHPTAT